MTTIGAYVPTAGRPSLKRLLHSIAQQRLAPGDEVLVLGDGPVPPAEQLCSAYGPPFRYVECQKSQPSSYGHAQCNEAFDRGLFTANVLVGNDDDDIFLPRAFEVIRSAADDNPGNLLAFQVQSGQDEGSFMPQNSSWDGHTQAVPRERAGRYGHSHDGDQEFVRSCYENCGRSRLIHKEVISLTRPAQFHTLDRLWDWEVRTPEQVEALRNIRNDCRLFMTHAQDEITPRQQDSWWASADHDNLWAYLYTEGDNRDYLAFSLLRRLDGKIRVSYGLAERARGRGLGYDMIKHALAACQGDAYGDLLETNTAIWHMDQKCGWREIGRHDGIIEVHRPWPVRQPE